MGFYAGQAKLYDFAVSVLNETRLAHPKMFDPDLELAKFTPLRTILAKPLES